jgi:hypothetical protein
MWMLDCTKHRLNAKSQVEGRSKDFDTLFEEFITSEVAYFRNRFNTVNAAFDLTSLSDVPRFAIIGNAVTSLESRQELFVSDSKD